MGRPRIEASFAEIMMIENIWQSSAILKYAFDEQVQCLKDTYDRISLLLSAPSDAPAEFRVGMALVPEEFFSLRKNIFSVLFQSMYQLLGISKERRLLYGKLNHLFRAWVTSADNLLDAEEKVVIPMRIPGDSRVMRQVITIMSADRIMRQILDDAIGREVISYKDSEVLCDGSLQILLPSAAEEAAEEGGIIQRPSPDYILGTIHKLKTGFLFHIPFLGPERIDKGIDAQTLNKCKEALSKFGLGCQLLDDIRDMARDYLEKRHNYVLSKIFWEEKVIYIKYLMELENTISACDKIFSYFPETVYPAAELAKNLLQEALGLLSECGLYLGKFTSQKMVLSMFRVLGVEDLELQRC